MVREGSVNGQERVQEVYGFNNFDEMNYEIRLGSGKPRNLDLSSAELGTALPQLVFLFYHFESFSTKLVIYIIKNDILR